MLFLAVACSDKSIKMNKKGILDKETFTEILIDIHKMDAMSSEVRHFRDYGENDTIDLHSMIFEKYNTTRTIFDSTVNNYSKNPELLKEIYDEVLQRLNMELDSLSEAEFKDLKENNETINPDREIKEDIIQ